MIKKLKHTHRLFAVAAPLMLFLLQVNAQPGAHMASGTNTGVASWGVSTGASAFIVNGSYNANAGATDHFYDITGTGTPIEISGSVMPVFSMLIFANGTNANATVTNTSGIKVNATFQSLNSIIFTPESFAAAIVMGDTATFTGSTVFGSSHFIDGYLSKTGNSSFTFPVGNQTIYSPTTFGNPAGTSVRYRTGDPGRTYDNSTAQGTLNLDYISTLEYYMVSSDAPSGSMITIPYNNFGTSGYTGSSSNLTIAGWNGVQWFNLGTHTNNIDVNAKTVSIALNQPLTGFTKMTVGSTFPFVLPVQFVNVDGMIQKCAAKLSWQTANEIAIRAYDVEISTTGIEYKSVGKITSHNNIAGSSYVFNYNNILSGNSFFRIKCIEADGSYRFSKTVMLYSNCNSPITVAPNPAKDVVYVRGLSGSNTIVLYDGAGKEIKRIATIQSSQALHISELPGGKYVVQVVDKDGNITAHQIVKQ